MLVRKGRLPFSVVEDSGNETVSGHARITNKIQSLRHGKDFSFSTAIKKEGITINVS